MYLFFKRLIDILVSCLVTLLLSPLLIPIVIGLKLTGEGYIFYKQERVGFKNAHFNILKFATMLKDSPNMKGGIMTTKGDHRITPMGGFLRKTKINELPQVFNVLLGKMTLVGPRPVMPVSFAQYPQDVQKVIYDRKPGITGIGSIIFRDEEELITKVKENGQDPWTYYKTIIYPYKGKLEQWYQKNKSLYTDFLLIFLTAWVIIFPESKLSYRLFSDLPKRENTKPQHV